MGGMAASELAQISDLNDPVAPSKDYDKHGNGSGKDLDANL